jgi:hypothetical protein
LQERWDNARPNTWEDTQAQRPDGAALQLTQIGIGRPGAGEQRRPVPQHEPPGLGQRCLADTRPPLDKPRLEETLQRCQLLAHTRLAIAEPARRRSDRPLLRHRSQRSEVAQLNTCPL